MTNVEVGKYCKSLRENASLTRVALAEMFGLPERRINSIENGKVYVREYEAKSYSQLFDVPESKFYVAHPKVREEKRYLLMDKMHELKAELGVSRLSLADMAKETGISAKRLSNITTSATGATEEEVELIAKYYGKDKEWFMTEPITVKMCTKKREEENEMSEESVSTATEKILAMPIDGAITSDKIEENVDIWRDKAHKLHRELGEARREIERLKCKGGLEANEWHDAYNELLANYEASQNDNKELVARIEEIVKERDSYREKYDTLEVAFDALEKESLSLKDVEMKYKMLSSAHDRLRADFDALEKESAGFEDLQAKYDMLLSAHDTLEAECDKYKEIICKVAVKFADLLVNHL